MLNASYSYESGESSAAYEHNSQRSEEPPPAVESMMESARLSDKRLHEVAAAAVSSVNWGELDMELAAASLSEKHESVWKRKKSPRGYANSDAMKLFTRLTVRDRRHQTRWGPKGFAVLAEGTLPCTVQEMRLVFRVASTDMFRDMMRCIYRREFVEGEQLRTIRIQRSAGNPARAFENRELSVKTATFESGGLFSKNESWCFLELLHPRDRAKEEQSTRRTASSTASAISATPPPAFTRTLVSIARSSVVLDNALAPPPRSTPHVPNVVINYSFEEDPSGRATRVVFHGEYLPPDALDAFKRAGHERRLARLWLLRLAASCHRFLLVVRRRRLGMQVIINSTRLPLETVANVPRCACCRRSFSTFFKRTRKRLCCLCGFLVCEKCAHAQEREHRARGDTRPQIEQVRVCERCLLRVDRARYTAVTEEDLRPARVISDSSSPVGRANSTPGGSLRGIGSRRTRPTLKTRPASLNDLLLETLADATAGGEAQRKRKASVLSVMKDIVDEERARRRSSAARIRSASAGVSRRGLPLLGERDEETDDDGTEEAEDEPVDDVERLKRMWGETPCWEDDYPLANADSRSYQIEFPQDPMEAIIPPIPSNEYKRLELIRQQQLNELGDELACAVSMITVVDKAQLHVLASTHPAVPGGMSYPREQGFCAQTILDPHPLVSRHVQADVRFSALSSVRKMGINFYCGFPLMGPDGKTVIGSVCCADPQARDLTRSQYAAMSSLASTASRVVQRAAEHRAVREGSADV
ncbi:GAF domain-containing protein [Phytophthora infestans T30-4]|uniref:GAF domain-containing protein n=1 Tax=Phytophthora infestans (strain T30-4) TaxID=403677 RepID=D0NBC5_PHYIT|nr:GAF domain-containing protein [Phytophthora infestans T30-4]EEY55354.1 GAF domain-containing protein [Phytophthora infestans T30-4]|eukprot:XP_002903578.1 GAF domain-containing protein [Phytophthora infestans T30-4]